MACDAFVSCYAAQYAVQHSNLEMLMCWHCNFMVGWGFSDELYMTSYLVNLPVLPMAAKSIDQFAAADVSRKLHPRASTSSRTKWRRIDWGLGPSKK